MRRFTSDPQSSFDQTRTLTGAVVLRLSCAAALLTGLMVGCTSPKATINDLRYGHKKDDIGYYREHATSIAYPCVDTQTAEAVAVSDEPRNLLRRTEDEPREIALNEAIRIALSRNEVIETTAFGGVGAKAVLTNPANVNSVYDPAIQASGILFGRRSVESALSDFDASFISSLTWSRNDMIAGNFPASGNRTNFTSSLSKRFASSASIDLHHDWTFTGDPTTYTGVSPSATPNYYGRLGVDFRQPLLAGSGTEYTRIAGPTNPNLGPITGVSQGVVIARINEDISIASFEIAVRNALFDIENSYWDLFLAYRSYDTAVVAHKSAFQTWRELQDRLEVGVLKPAEELQARDRLYETKAEVETSLNTLFKAESELRRLIGLPMNDGTVLRPADEPVMVEVVPDWKASLQEALTQRVELRRQKWNVKSNQLQLQAARSLVRPRVDFVAGYDVQGAGDTLLSESGTPFRSAYGSMTNQNINSWSAGLQVSVPIGQRFARTQVRNLELQLAKSIAVLASQEKNIAHDISLAIQDVTASYLAAQTNYNRLEAASRRVELLSAERDVGTLTLDLVLRAQASVAAAENAYYQQMVTYNKSIAALHRAKGTLLDHNGVVLAEGQWEPAAICDALIHAQARTHAKDAPQLQTEPAEFASPGPTGSVELRASSLIRELNPEAAPVEPIPELNPPELPPAPPEDDTGTAATGSQKANFAEPESIFDPFRHYEKDPPRSASSRNADFPDFDLLRQ